MYIVHLFSRKTIFKNINVKSWVKINLCFYYKDKLYFINNETQPTGTI